MKKITTFVVIAILAFAVVSCNKSSSLDLSNRGSSGQQDQPKPEVTAVSNWISVFSFSVETDMLGNRFIKGTAPFTSSTQLIYDENLQVELVYIRMPSGQGFLYKYKRLPFDLKIVDNGASGNVQIDYSLDPGGLKLYFKNADYSFLARALDQLTSEKWDFRYIVIPKTKYQSTNVDWDDLIAVAAALNLSL